MMKVFLRSILIVLILAVFPPARANAEPIRVAYSSISGAMGPLWAASDFGLFKRQGLDVQLLYIGGGSVVTQALLGGDVQFVRLGASAVMQASMRGADLKMIANTINRLVFTLMAKPEIKSPPLPLQIQTALKIFPFKRLGFLFNPREKNSMLVRDKIAEVAKQSRFEVVDLRSPPAQEMLQENLQKLRDKSIAVDAIYLPPDSFLVSSAQLIGSELRAAKIKSIASIGTFIEKGALMGVVPDYEELGKAAAMIVHSHQH